MIEQFSLEYIFSFYTLLYSLSSAWIQIEFRLHWRENRDFKRPVIDECLLSFLLLEWVINVMTKNVEASEVS